MKLRSISATAPDQLRILGLATKRMGLATEAEETMGPEIQFRFYPCQFYLNRVCGWAFRRSLSQNAWAKSDIIMVEAQAGWPDGMRRFLANLAINV